MFKFKNRHGVTITTRDLSTANDYRQRPGFTEVVAKPKPVSKPADEPKSK